MSYANVLMYSSVLPSYGYESKDKKRDGKIYNGDDPKQLEMFFKS